MTDRKRYVRIEGKDNLYRDKTSNAIVNTDSSEYERFKQKAREINEINSMKQELEELKSLIKDLKKD